MSWRQRCRSRKHWSAWRRRAWPARRAPRSWSGCAAGGPTGCSARRSSRILGNFAIDAEDRIAPHLTYENHLQIVHGLWEQRPSQLFAHVVCPTLIIPAELSPAETRAAAWLDRKRRAVAVAEATIPHARVVWAHDTIHDVQLQRPEWLASELVAFAREIRMRFDNHNR